MRDYKNKTIVITGAGSGIGRSLAIALSREGANIALCDINTKNLSETEQVIRSSPVNTLAMKVDVANLGEFKEFAAQVSHKLGGADVLINNAGISMSELIESMTPEQLHSLLWTNFGGVVHGCHAFLPQLKVREEGQIVNVGSVFSFGGQYGQAAYVSSKFAIRGYTETLIMELRKTKIAVSLAVPGAISTNLISNGHHSKKLLGSFDTSDFARLHERTSQNTPDACARKLIAGMRRGRRRIIIGGDARLLTFLATYAPRIYEQVVLAYGRMVQEGQRHL